MPDWLVWLILSGALAVAEIVTLTFVLAMLAGGAVAAGVAAALGAPVVVQVGVAVVTSGALLVGVRPTIQRHALSSTASVRTGAERLVGCEAIVLARVGAHDGRVRLNGGEWSARAFDHSQDLPAGSVVRVMSIDGATAVVWRDPTLG